MNSRKFMDRDPEVDQKAGNHWFWRTYDQQEIDLVEESPDGTRLSAFEFKWDPAKKARLPKLFLETYPHAESGVITPEKAREWLME